MDYNKNFITNYQLFSTMIVTIIGVGNFSYPSNIAEQVGTDGWIVTIICGLIIYALLYGIYKIQKINGYKDFMSILRSNFGGVLSKIIAIIFVALNIVLVSIGMRIFAEVLKMYLLEKTPTEFIIVTMIIVGSLVIRSKLQNLIRFNEICFWIIFIPMCFIMILLTRHGDFTNILPMLQNKPFNYIKAIGLAVFAFEGFEIGYLVMPHVKEKSKIPKVMFASVSFIVVFYALLCIIALSIFGLEQTKILIWPTITMIKSINIPGYFIEQWEGVVMIFWILFYITTFVNLYFFSSTLVKDIFNLEDVKLSTVLITPFIYICAMYPENLAEVYRFSGNISIILPVFTVVILILLLLFISLVKRRVKK